MLLQTDESDYADYYKKVFYFSVSKGEVIDEREHKLAQSISSDESICTQITPFNSSKAYKIFIGYSECKDS